jgi:hypothetical protein
MGTGEPAGGHGEREARNQVEGNHQRGGRHQQRASQVQRIHQSNGQGQAPACRRCEPCRRTGAAAGKESAVLAARESSTAPAIFTAPASNSSERIHFQASRRSAAETETPMRRRLQRGRPEPCARVARQVEGARTGGRVPGRVLDMVRDQAQQRHQAREQSRNPVTSFSLLCWVGDKSFITLAGG